MKDEGRRICVGAQLPRTSDARTAHEPITLANPPGVLRLTAT